MSALIADGLPGADEMIGPTTAGTTSPWLGSGGTRQTDGSALDEVVGHLVVEAVFDRTAAQDRRDLKRVDRGFGPFDGQGDLTYDGVR
ncbi:MAG: hypothetical protein P1T08_02615 [Acidimicrobiia bacterium]|nr:hypothetical protein [Acidimicrobiia bacterium]